MSPNNPGIQRLQDLVNDLRGNYPLNKKIPIVLGEIPKYSSVLSKKLTQVYNYLVPGFSAWGQPLLGVVNYFGGFSDFASALAAEGYAVIEVRLGPLSSNRERACEIFQQLNNISVNAAGVGT